MRAYFTQLRQELGSRLVEKVFGQEQKPSKVHVTRVAVSCAAVSCVGISCVAIHCVCVIIWVHLFNMLYSVYNLVNMWVHSSIIVGVCIM